MKKIHSFKQFVYLSLFFLLYTLCFMPSNAYAGAWPIKKGQWNVELFSRLYKADKNFNSSGKKESKANGAKYEDFRTEVKTAYGVTDKFNVEVDIPYSWSEWTDANGTLKNKGVTDIWVKAKYNVIKEKPVVFSVQGAVKIPDAYDTADSPALGDGQWDGEIRVQVGKSFYPKGFYENYEKEAMAQEGRHRRNVRRSKVSETLGDMENRILERRRAARQRREWEEESGGNGMFSSVAEKVKNIGSRPWFVGAELGYRMRGEAPADEIPYVVEGGLWVSKKVMVKAMLDAVEAINANGSRDKDYGKIGLSIIYNIKGWGYGAVFGGTSAPQLNLELGLTKVVYGENTDAANEYYGKLLYLF